MSLLRKAAWCLSVPAAAGLTVVSAGPASAADDLYGALSVSPSTGTVAYAVNHNSWATADAGANVKCGVYDCEVVVHFANACGAVAQGADRRFGGAWAPTKVEAERAAVESLGLSAPPFPDLGSASPRAAQVVLSACTDNAQ
ncbi:DUF4189 domain-containing protein [Nocardia transvalensis]|uniref:DUF4189 domain-containing protein n=1 Tax=Nocardia transvalensis TaxID=37333 RepID=UPI0018960B69|nr:DUF4189 domain-containing protein [Nocardia transvalensis]MBF6331042.1 DUF4189 domain-containing protein [Nocardia transvalensis]